MVNSYRYTFSKCFTAVFLAMTVAWMTAVPAVAQTGPGGVGAADGSSNLVLWLRGDAGITTDATGVDTWADQSGYGNDLTRNAGDPSLAPGALNGRDVVSFDGDDGLNLTSATTGLSSLSDGANTVIVVTRNTDETDEDQFAFSVGGTDRVLAYQGKQSGTQGDALDFYAVNGRGINQDAVTIDGIGPSSFQIFSSVFNGSDLDIVRNGSGEGSNGGATRGGGDVGLGNAPSGGNNLTGDVAEVIAYNRELNTGELRLVFNYLAAKYGLTITDPVFGFDDYNNDVAGFGRDDSSLELAPGGASTVGQSSILQSDPRRTLNDGEFALFGHDDGSLTFVSSERPNSETTAQKIGREWRVQHTGAPQIGVNFEIDVSQLPALGTGYNEYALFIDDDGDFSSGAEFVDLEDQGGGVYATSGLTVIEDGDYLTVARINRTVGFAETSGSEVEGTRIDATVTLNYPNTTDIDVSFTSVGDLDNDGTIEPDGNGNGRFEADPGNDFDVPTSSPLAISSSTEEITTRTFDDSEIEQTEEYELRLSGVTGPASLSSETDVFVASILDDDEPRKVSFADGDYTDGTDNDPNYSPTSTEGSGGTSRVERFTLDLDGGTASSSSPCTSVQFNVLGTSTATAGVDLTDPTVDFRILNENDPGGTCPEYQERVSATEGRVYFSSGSSEATLKLEINEDDVEDADTESIELELSNPVSSAVGSPDQTVFEITDDDAAPTVAFTGTSFGGDESVDADVTVELSSVSGTDLTIAFNDVTGSGNEFATEGDDYDFPSPAETTILAGETTATFTIPVTDDQVKELNEKIQLEIDGTSSDVSASSPSSAEYVIFDNEPLGISGPGGVGNTEGDGRLKLWLRADQGVTTSGGVSSWNDQSGNNNNATQSTSGDRPTLQSAQFNGFPAIGFDGSSQHLDHPLLSFSSSSNTVFIVSSTADATTQQGLFSVAADVGGGVIESRTLRYQNESGAGARAFNGEGTAGAGVGDGSLSTVSVTSSVFDGSNVDLSVNGALSGGSYATSSDVNTASGVVGVLGAEVEDSAGRSGLQPSVANFLDGSIAEVVAFDTEVNEAQRIIISNYLAAKYGISLGANDLYAGDTGANGDYDVEVVGIGQSGSNDIQDSHTRAQGGGVTISVNTGLDDGEFLFLGRQSAPGSGINTADVTTTDATPITTRAEQLRFSQQIGAFTADLVVDLSNFGLRGPTGTVGNYYLLHRAAPGDDWTVVEQAASASTGTLTFSGVDLPTGGGYITIGTTDYVDSPLDTRYTAVRGTAGDEGTSGSNGGDAGYLTLGLPITGGTASSLVNPDGSQFFTSTSLGLTGLNSSTRILYTWDYASQRFTVVTDPSTALPNGTGFYFWAKDDDTYFPIDPELTFGLNDVTNEQTGDVEETVPDASGTFVFLANPYLSAFDMTTPAFTDLANNGFQASIASWDPDNGGLYGSYVIKTQGTSDDEIARYQGFFLERTSTGSGTTTFNFDATGRITDRNEVLVGAKSSTNSASTLNYRRLSLKLSVQNSSGREVAGDVAATVLFTDRASAGWDAYDLPKYQPLSSRYATVAPLGSSREGTEIPKSVESRPLTLNETIEIPLQVSTKNLSGTFVLSPRQMENIPDDWSITLIDTKATSASGDDGRVELSSLQSAYEFDVTTSKTASVPGGDPVRPEPKTMAKSTSDPRFVLRINPQGGTLPVELSSLGAKTDGRDVIVEWSTSTETNSAGFAVERKTGAGTFTEVGFVESTGSTQEAQQYRYRIENLDYGTQTFRLRQVDSDGSASYSKEVSTTLRLDEAYLVGKPYPNPFQNRTTLEVTVREAQNVQVELYDLLGRRIQVLHDGRIRAQDTRRLQVRGANLSSGHYFLRVTGEGFTETRRITLVQ